MYIYDREFNTVTVAPASQVLQYVVLLLLIVRVSYNGNLFVTIFVQTAHKLQRIDTEHDVLSNMHTFLLFKSTYFIRKTISKTPSWNLKRP
jgi:hypothetical protein